MKQEDIAEGRRLLAALTPGPYMVSRFVSHSGEGYGIASLPLSTERGVERIEDARAVLWLLQHAEELLSLAEHVAAIKVQTTPQMLEDQRTYVTKLVFEAAMAHREEVLLPREGALLGDATALAALVEAVRS